MRLSSLLLLTSASLVSAHWSDYLSRVLGTQKPLADHIEEVDQREVIERRWVRNVTWSDWEGIIEDATVAKGGNAAETPEEWYFYFTTSNVNGTRNATKWDQIFEEATVKLAIANNLAGSAPKISLGKVDCAVPEALKLCQTFFLTSQKKLPEIYHIAFFGNGTVGIREVTWPTELVEGDQPAYLVKFHTEGLWKSIDAWSGIFNPIDGELKDYVVPYLATALGYYEMLPPWVMMVAISILGRNIMSRITRPGGLTHPSATPTTAARAS